MKRTAYLFGLVLLVAVSPLFARGKHDSPLASIHKIYIAPMPNGLDQYIRAEMFHRMPGRIEVVTKRSLADAVLEGTDNEKHGAWRAIDRWTEMSDTATAAISLVSADGSAVLWSTTAGDRSLWLGVLARGGNRKLAERIVKHLKKAMGK